MATETVDIDISKIAQNGNGVTYSDDSKTYSYDNGNVTLVSNNSLNELNGYDTFTHTPKIGYSINRITKGNVPQGEFTDLNICSSVTVYFWVQDTGYKYPLIIQLDTKNVYYVISGDNKWTKIELDAKGLLERLDQENCKYNRAHHVDLSKSLTTQSGQTYLCPGCSSTEITVQSSIFQDYSYYEHSISEHSVSIFRFFYQEKRIIIPISKNAYQMTVYFYPKDIQPLLVNVSTSWYKSVLKSDTWNTVSENPPSNSYDQTTVRELLKTIHKETESKSGTNSNGLSTGAKAGYSTAGVMTPLATAEAVNYTLNTGWSVIRRVMAIFNAAI